MARPPWRSWRRRPPPAAPRRYGPTAGADVVALDGTLRRRPDGRSLREHVAEIREQVGVELMADVDALEAGVAAREAGVDLVATTLSGYTAGEVTEGPDLELVAALAR